MDKNAPGTSLGGGFDVENEYWYHGWRNFISGQGWTMALRRIDFNGRNLVTLQSWGPPDHGMLQFGADPTSDVAVYATQKTITVPSTGNEQKIQKTALDGSGLTTLHTYTRPSGLAGFPQVVCNLICPVGQNVAITGIRYATTVWNDYISIIDLTSGSETQIANDTGTIAENPNYNSVAYYNGQVYYVRFKVVGGVGTSTFGRINLDGTGKETLFTVGAAGSSISGHSVSIDTFRRQMFYILGGTDADGAGLYQRDLDTGSSEKVVLGSLLGPIGLGLASWHEVYQHWRSTRDLVWSS